MSEGNQREPEDPDPQELTEYCLQAIQDAVKGWLIIIKKQKFNPDFYLEGRGLISPGRQYIPWVMTIFKDRLGPFELHNITSDTQMEGHKLDSGKNGKWINGKGSKNGAEIWLKTCEYLRKDALEGTSADGSTLMAPHKLCNKFFTKQNYRFEMSDLN